MGGLQEPQDASPLILQLSYLVLKTEKMSVAPEHSRKGGVEHSSQQPDLFLISQQQGLQRRES